MNDGMEQERSSDKLVDELRGELSSHRIKVDSYMREVKQHIQGEDAKWVEMIALTQDNAYAIGELRKELRKKSEQVAELISLNTRFKAVSWFAGGLGKFTVALAAAVLAYNAIVTWVVGK